MQRVCDADEIAKELSPFPPESVAIEAGRLMLERIKKLASEKVDFAFETTLSAKLYSDLINDLQTKGYQVKLIYVWLNSVKLAENRVADRVDEGGHNIPIDTIARGYTRGLNNLLNLYLPLVNN